MKNLVILIGNLGADPELKSTQSGSVTTLSVATSESYTDKQGKKITNTEWHRVVLWNKVAEIACKYLNKGSQVCIEGKITYRSYEKDGVKQYITEIVGYKLDMLGGGKKAEEKPFEERPTFNPDEKPGVLPF